MKLIYCFLILLFSTLSLAKDGGNAAAIRIRIALELSDNSPYERGDLKPVSGFHIELVKAVAAQKKWKIEWYPLPWSRALRMVEKGSVEAILFVTPTPERETYMSFHKDNYLHEDIICVVSRRDVKSAFDGTLESLAEKKFALPRDYVLSPAVEEFRAKVHLKEISGTFDQALEMLTRGRIDYTLVERTSFNVWKKEKPKMFLRIKILEPCFKGVKRYIGFSKAVPRYRQIEQQFAEALNEFRKTKAYTDLLKKYELNFGS